MGARRAVWVKIRASEAERAEWHAKARSVGLSLSDLVRTMPVSDPDVSRPRLIRDASFLEADRREIALRRVSPEPSFSREPAVELDPTDAVVHSIAPPPNQLRCEAMIRARAPDGRGRRGG